MQFEKNILSLYGQQGQSWLNNLPHLTEKLAKTWGLSDVQVLQKLSDNYVASCTQGNVPIILKIGFNKNEVHSESETIFFYTAADIQLSFVKDKKDTVTKLTLHQIGKNLVAERKKP